jgi:hypothetical protein
MDVGLVDGAVDGLMLGLNVGLSVGIICTTKSTIKPQLSHSFLPSPSHGQL